MQPKFPSLEHPSLGFCSACQKGRTGLWSTFARACPPADLVATVLTLLRSAFSSQNTLTASPLLGNPQCSMQPQLQGFHGRWFPHLFSSPSILSLKRSCLFFLSSSYLVLVAIVRTRATETAHFVCRGCRLHRPPLSIQSGGRRIYNFICTDP